MFYEHSAGIIIFKGNSKRKYLILKYGHGHWDFPRGKIEKNETEKETAIREIKEETGIRNLKFINGFKEKVEWKYKKNNNLIHKTAVLFLAKTDSDVVNLSDEHLDYKWLSFNDTIDILTFKNPKVLLKKAEEFLN